MECKPAVKAQVKGEDADTGSVEATPAMMMEAVDRFVSKDKDVPLAKVIVAKVTIAADLVVLALGAITAMGTDTSLETAISRVVRMVTAMATAMTAIAILERSPVWW